MRILWTLALVLLVANGAGAQTEDDKARAKKIYEEAETNYQLGRFKEALEGFSYAYEIAKLPAFLFNIAQCHRQLKNFERAIFFFEGYLRELPSSRNRAVVEELIAECKSAKSEAEAALAKENEKKEADKRKAIELEIARKDAERAARVAEAQRLVKEQQTLSLTLEEQRPVYKRWWFWAAVGGAVAVAGGVTAYMLLSEDDGGAIPQGSVGTLDRQ